MTYNDWSIIYHIIYSENHLNIQILCCFSLLCFKPKGKPMQIELVGALAWFGHPDVPRRPGHLSNFSSDKMLGSSSWFCRTCHGKDHQQIMSCTTAPWRKRSGYNKCWKYTEHVNIYCKCLKHTCLNIIFYIQYIILCICKMFIYITYVYLYIYIYTCKYIFMVYIYILTIALVVQYPLAVLHPKDKSECPLSTRAIALDVWIYSCWIQKNDFALLWLMVQRLSVCYWDIISIWSSISICHVTGISIMIFAMPPLHCRSCHELGIGVQGRTDQIPCLNYLIGSFHLVPLISNATNKGSPMNTHTHIYNI